MPAAARRASVASARSKANSSIADDGASLDGSDLGDVSPNNVDSEEGAYDANRVYGMDSSSSGELAFLPVLDFGAGPGAEGHSLDGKKQALAELPRDPATGKIDVSGPRLCSCMLRN